MSRENRSRITEAIKQKRKSIIKQKPKKDKSGIPISYYVPTLKGDLFNYMFPVSGNMKNITILVEKGPNDIEIPIIVSYRHNNNVFSITENIMLGDNYISESYLVDAGGVLSIKIDNPSIYNKKFSKIYISFIIEVLD